jgi:hypothetical protein
MSKHRILAGSTAPWLRTALTRVQDRVADDVKEQIEAINSSAAAGSALVVLMPPRLADKAGIDSDILERQTIHGLPVLLTHEVAAAVVVSEYLCGVIRAGNDSVLF